MPRTKAFLIVSLLLYCTFEAGVADDLGAPLINVHLQCIRDNLLKLDDGKTTPEQLAILIVPLCHTPFVEAYESFNGDPATPEQEQANTAAGIRFVKFRMKRGIPLQP